MNRYKMHDQGKDEYEGLNLNADTQAHITCVPIEQGIFSLNFLWAMFKFHLVYISINVSDGANQIVD